MNKIDLMTSKIDPNAEIACKVLYKDLIEKIDEIKNISVIQVINLGVNILKYSLHVCENDVKEFMLDLAPIIEKWADKM